MSEYETEVLRAMGKKLQGIIDELRANAREDLEFANEIDEAWKEWDIDWLRDNDLITHTEHKAALAEMEEEER